MNQEQTVAEKIRRSWEKCDPNCADILLALRNEPDIETAILNETIDILYTKS